MIASSSPTTFPPAPVWCGGHCQRWFSQAFPPRMPRLKLRCNACSGHRKHRCLGSERLLLEWISPQWCGHLRGPRPDNREVGRGFPPRNEVRLGRLASLGTPNTLPGFGRVRLETIFSSGVRGDISILIEGGCCQPVDVLAVMVAPKGSRRTWGYVQRFAFCGPGFGAPQGPPYGAVGVVVAQDYPRECSPVPSRCSTQP